MAMLAELWAAGVAAEILMKEAPKIQAQLKYAETSRIPWAVILGPDELRVRVCVPSHLCFSVHTHHTHSFFNPFAQNGQVKLKNLASGEQTVYARADAVRFLKTVNINDSSAVAAPKVPSQKPE